MPFQKGQKGYWLDKKRDKKTKEKISKTRKKLFDGGLLKIWCDNKKLSTNHINNLRKSHTGKCGETSSRWIKDRTKLAKKQERNDSAYQDWVRQVKKRDNRRCKINNEDCSGYCIVHHILGWAEYPELRYNINNGITLCQAHHPRKRNEEKQFISFFQKLLKAEVGIK